MLVDQLVDLDMDTGQKVVRNAIYLSFSHSCFLGNENINRVAPWVVVGKMCRMTRGGFWVTSRWRPWVERWLPAAVSATPTIPPQKTAPPPRPRIPTGPKKHLCLLPRRIDILLDKVTTKSIELLLLPPLIFMHFGYLHAMCNVCNAL